MTEASGFLGRLEQSATSVRVTTPLGAMVWRRWGAESPPMPPVVLLHGGSGSWRHWARNIMPLSAVRTVWVPDLPGMGDSETPKDPPNRPEAASAVIAALDALLPAQSFDLAGFSYGGSIAAIVTELAPERVRSLTLVGTAGFGGNRDPQTVRVNGLTGADRAAAHRANLLSLMIKSPARVDDLAIEIQEANTARRRLRLSRDRGTPYLPGALQAYRGPLRVVWGAHDQFSYGHIDDYAARMRTMRADVEVKVFEGAGHWVPYEDADAFNGFLLARL